MAILFTSDTHFDHAKVIEYCKRPFSSVDEMNAEMVRRWNARVTPADTVYHLGDFHMGRAERIAYWRAQLNGRIVLVKGNHDRSKTAMLRAGFDEVVNEAWIPGTGDERIYLRHIPKQQWTAKAGLHLCGHVHTEWRESQVGALRVINVGVDQWDFTPRTLAELTAG